MKRKKKQSARGSRPKKFWPEESIDGNQPYAPRKTSKKKAVLV